MHIATHACPPPFHAGWLPWARQQAGLTLSAAAASSDPRVQQGLAEIARLDAKLLEKHAAAEIVSRELDPDAWEAAQRRRAERQQRRTAKAVARCVLLAITAAQPPQQRQTLSAACERSMTC